MSSDKIYDISDGEIRKSKTNLNKLEIYFNTCNHVVIGIITVYVTIIAYRAGGTLYNWHAWLCTIGVS